MTLLLIFIGLVLTVIVTLGCKNKKGVQFYTRQKGLNGIPGCERFFLGNLVAMKEYMQKVEEVK